MEENEEKQESSEDRAADYIDRVPHNALRVRFSCKKFESKLTFDEFLRGMIEFIFENKESLERLNIREFFKENPNKRDENEFLKILFLLSEEEPWQVIQNYIDNFCDTVFHPDIILFYPNEFSLGYPKRSYI